VRNPGFLGAHREDASVRLRRKHDECCRQANEKRNARADAHARKHRTWKRFLMECYWKKL